MLGMTQPKQHGLWFHLLDVVFNIVVIVAIVAGIRTFLVSPFQVEGSSMASTLESEEYIIINKLAYHIGSPERGDIVVFRPPNAPEKYYVKRVIGLPGDKVIIKSGLVYLQKPGETEPTELDESYLDERNSGRTCKSPRDCSNTETTVYDVPEGQYFVLGDNRQGSFDSRSFTAADGTPQPYIEEEEVKGRVWFVALPITKIHAFEPPEYNL